MALKFSEDKTMDGIMSWISENPDKLDATDD